MKKQPHEMNREEFAAYYRERQIAGFAEYLEQLRAEIGGREPRMITETRVVPASEADRKLVEKIKGLRELEQEYDNAPLPFLDAKQLHAQRQGEVEDARRAGHTVSDEVLAELEADDPWREFEASKKARKKANAF